MYPPMTLGGVVGQILCEGCKMCTALLAILVTLPCGGLFFQVTAIMIVFRVFLYRIKNQLGILLEGILRILVVTV